MSAHGREQLAAYKVPRSWVFVETFPLTGLGKVQKFVLREQYLEGVRDLRTHRLDQPDRGPRVHRPEDGDRHDQLLAPGVLLESCFGGRRPSVLEPRDGEASRHRMKPLASIRRTDARLSPRPTQML